MIEEELNEVDKKSVVQIYRIDRRDNVFILCFISNLSGVSLILKLRYEN